MNGWSELSSVEIGNRFSQFLIWQKWVSAQNAALLQEPNTAEL